MPRSAARILALVLALAGFPLSLAGISAQEASPVAEPPAFPPPSANVTVFAEGLDNPRGLEFGPDGLLYVAEGGQGGTRSTEGECEQVVPPVGPYTGGDTARISALDADGQRTTVAEGLPSTQLSPALGSLVSGVADIAFVDDTLYYLLAAGGCSHGNPDVPNGIFRVNEDGTTELVADLSAFVQANPTAVQNPGDFEPDESAYGLELFNDELYVAESNHGALDAVDPATGEVRRVVDMTETEGHLVPTAMAVGQDGNLYVSNLTTFPITAGAAQVFTVTPDGELEVVATGLVFPTGMAFGPDGTLCVSNYGFGFPPGAGQVVTIDVSAPLPEATPEAAGS